MSPVYKFFVLNIDLIDEPKYYNEAVRFSEWRTAMSLELDALVANILGLLFLYPKKNMLLGVNGYTKLNISQMGELRDIKLGW